MTIEAGTTEDSGHLGGDLECLFDGYFAGFGWRVRRRGPFQGNELSQKKGGGKTERYEKCPFHSVHFFGRGETS